MWSVKGNAFVGGMPYAGGAPVPGSAPPGNAGAGNGPGGVPNLPPIPTVFPELEKMSINELEVLWSSEAALAKFVNEHEHRRAVASILDGLSKEIEDLTKSNEAKLNEAHSSQSQEEAEKEKQLEEDLKRQIRKKKEEKDRLWEFNSPSAIHERLQVARAGSVETSEKFKEQFLRKELELAEFMRLYTMEQKRVHQITALIEDIAPHLN
uniref:VPS37 C-terminal domain-containing protein n=1 Tax=Rhodosorus marinus TaxID=101924 RepID=A0A7S0BEH6_9RHOD|mmetsp:Transcript_11245/g.16260  ORF Transcript_11245/g.16260 Transcript_11245/m.16260 type:complete len:209 (+) Transcript_11245:137-763(+)